MATFTEALAEMKICGEGVITRHGDERNMVVSYLSHAEDNNPDAVIEGIRDIGGRPITVEPVGAMILIDDILADDWAWTPF